MESFTFLPGYLGEILRMREVPSQRAQNQFIFFQSKISVSALSLRRTKGVSYNTVPLIKDEIQQVMKERDDSKPLDAAYIQVDDAYWEIKSVMASEEEVLPEKFLSSQRYL